MSEQVAETKKEKAFPWKHVVQEGLITMMWGASGGGKSTLTNYYELEMLKQGKVVLHIEEDERQSTMVKRLSSMNGWVGCPTELVKKNLRLMVDKEMKLDTDGGAEVLRKMMQKHNPDVLVLSPVGMMTEEDTNLQKPAAAFYRNLKKAMGGRSVTTILHGHLNKKGRPTGSQNWTNFTDMAWILEKRPDVIDGQAHRMEVVRLKDRNTVALGFDWELAAPDHRIRFLRYKSDTMTVEERGKIRSVLGFVYDQTRENVREAKNIMMGQSRRKTAVPSPWVTIPDYLKAHEGTMGGKMSAYDSFNLAREFGLIGQLTNGPKGVQRFFPSQATVDWLEENKQELPDRAPEVTLGVQKGKAKLVVKHTKGWPKGEEPITTEADMTEEIWESTSAEEKDTWMSTLEDYEPDENEIEQEADYYAKWDRERRNRG